MPFLGLEKFPLNGHGEMAIGRKCPGVLPVLASKLKATVSLNSKLVFVAVSCSPGENSVESPGLSSGDAV